MDGLEAALQQVSTLVGNSKATVILAGNFNCKDICWDTHSSLPENPIPSLSEKLLGLSDENGLAQLQCEPTRQDSLLDLFITSNKSLVSSIDTILGISTASEHDVIVVDTSLGAQRTKTSQLMSNKTSSNNTYQRLLINTCPQSHPRRGLTSRGSPQTWRGMPQETASIQQVGEAYSQKETMCHSHRCL